MNAKILAKPQNNPKIESSRWGRKVLIIILILLCLYWLWEKISNPNTFPIRSVKIIDVSSHIDHPTLQNTITPYIEKGMLWLNLPSLENALNQLPWIEHVVVTRKWPDQLVIQIFEQLPIARWNKTNLLNHDGNIFTPEISSIPDNLPNLYGPDNMQTTVWQAYQEINQILAPVGLKIGFIMMTPRESWNVYLNNNMHLLLGHDDITNRLNRFVEVYPKLFQGQENKVDYVDLRYNNGLAVHWKNISAEN